MKIAFCLTAVFLAHCIGVIVVIADTEQPKPKPSKPPAVGLLAGVIEPFEQANQRAAFLKAAGTDTELAETEFKKHASDHTGFVRSFDRWSLITIFDEDKNNQIDWLEALEYRRASRVLIFANHDKDNNGRLDEKEKAAAERALRNGSLAKYFNVSCCGGKEGDESDTEEITDEELERIRKKLIAEGYEFKDRSFDAVRRRFMVNKKEALKLDRQIDGIFESQLMPISQKPTAEAFGAYLENHYSPQVKEFVSKEDLKKLEKYIYKELDWRLEMDIDGVPFLALPRPREGDPDGFNPEYLQRLKEDQKRRAANWALGDPPAFRFGIDKQGIELSTKPASELIGTKSSLHKILTNSEIVKASKVIVMHSIIQADETALSHTYRNVQGFSSDHYRMETLYLYSTGKPHPWFRLRSSLTPYMKGKR